MTRQQQQRLQQTMTQHEQQQQQQQTRQQRQRDDVLAAAAAEAVGAADERPHQQHHQENRHDDQCGQDGEEALQPEEVHDDDDDDPEEEDQQDSSSTLSLWKLYAYVIILIIDLILTCIVFLPTMPSMQRHLLPTVIHHHYTISFSVLDVAVLSVIRIVVIAAIMLSYSASSGYCLCWLVGGDNDDDDDNSEPSSQQRRQHPFLDLYHPNGERKTKEEIELEELEEPFDRWFRRYVSRPAYSGELVCLATQLWCVVKCLARLNVELDYDHRVAGSSSLSPDDHHNPPHQHPIFWFAILITSLLSLIEASYLETICKLLRRLAKRRRQRQRQRQQSDAADQQHDETMGAAAAAAGGHTNYGPHNENDDETPSRQLLRRISSVLRIPYLRRVSHSAMAVPLLSTGATDSPRRDRHERTNGDAAMNGDTASGDFCIEEQSIPIDDDNIDSDGLNRPSFPGNHDGGTDNGDGNSTNNDDDGGGDDDDQDKNARGISDITGDCNYKASWKDLLTTIYPDLYFIIAASVFLMAAAIAQVCIPRYLGNILDSLAEAFAKNIHHGDDNGNNNDDNRNDDPSYESMWDVPGFMTNIKLLLIASCLAGIFSGLRGSIFTIVGGRVNVRLRVQLMDSLLSQDIGFFDVTKTGDITSRLSSDTMLVGDQVTLNVNVFLRSIVQAIGVLVFMSIVSWQLTILAFVSVPAITVLSRWYGNYIRSLTKLMQKKLADGNAISEAALGSMATVRAFDAAESELIEFESYMKKYLYLNIRAAIAYFGFAAITTALPQLVYALVGTLRYKYR